MYLFLTHAAHQWTRHLTRRPEDWLFQSLWCLMIWLNSERLFMFLLSFGQGSKLVSSVVGPRLWVQSQSCQATVWFMCYFPTESFRSQDPSLWIWICWFCSNASWLFFIILFIFEVFDIFDKAKVTTVVRSLWTRGSRRELTCLFQIVCFADLKKQNKTTTTVVLRKG